MNWPGLLVPWLPSPTVIATFAIFGWLYLRGSPREKVPAARRLAFWTGWALLYVALQTRMDYYAERQFFVHRLQHVLLHHLGPFLIALSWPGPAARAGLPAGVRRAIVEPILGSRPFRAAMDVLMNPAISATLFVGLVWVWLVPHIHFYAMLDVRLYRLMNWTMAIDGLFFWLLTLDPRPSPPARLKPGVRVMLLVAVMPPQIAPAALITFATSNLYPLYELCGRAFGGITTHQDQTLGGLILWILSSMMCAVGALVAMYYWFRNAEEAQGAAEREGVGEALHAGPAGR